MDGIEHLFVLMRAGDSQHLWVDAGDILGLGPHAAGDDDLAVFLQRLANGLKAFGLGAVKEPAGVDDHRVGPLIVRRNAVPLGPQAGQDTFTIHQRLGAAEADHADGRLTVAFGFHHAGAGKVGAKIGRVLGHEAAYRGAARVGEGRIATCDGPKL